MMYVTLSVLAASAVASDSKLAGSRLDVAPEPSAPARNVCAAMEVPGTQGLKLKEGYPWAVFTDDAKVAAEHGGFGDEGVSKLQEVLDVSPECPGCGPVREGLFIWCKPGRRYRNGKWVRTSEWEYQINQFNGEGRGVIVEYGLVESATNLFQPGTLQDIQKIVIEIQNNVWDILRNQQTLASKLEDKDFVPIEFPEPILNVPEANKPEIYETLYKIQMKLLDIASNQETLEHKMDDKEYMASYSNW